MRKQFHVNGLAVKSIEIACVRPDGSHDHLETRHQSRIRRKAEIEIPVKSQELEMEYSQVEPKVVAKLSRVSRLLVCIKVE